MVDSYKVGNFLVQLRNEKHLTQSQVADTLKISVKTISKWECGNGLPSIEYLPELASFYDVSVDEILNGERKRVEEKDASKPINPMVNNILCLSSIILSVLALFISLIVSLSSINGVAYIVILVVLSLLAGAVAAVSYFVNKDYRSLLLNGAICLLVSDLTLIVLSFFFVPFFRENVTMSRYVLLGFFFLSLIPSFVYFMYSFVKKTSFKGTIGWSKLIPTILCTGCAVVALMNAVFLLNSQSYGNGMSYTISILIFCIGAISSLFAIFFKKYSFVNDWVIVALLPLWLILIFALGANVIALEVIASFLYLYVYSIFGMVCFFTERKRNKNDSIKNEQNTIQD